MPDEDNSKSLADKERQSGMNLVADVEEEKNSARLPELAANELRELIREVQHKAPRKKTADDDLLPPAA